MQRWDARTAVVLLVEDDAGDQELTRRALTEGLFRADLRVVGDGEDALDYLLQRGAYADPDDCPFPDLMLLDLNMPKLDGRGVLRAVKSDERLRHLPVVVLTTSQQETDIVRSYGLGCNSFITKPVDGNRFVEVIRALGTYWFELATLPQLAVATV
jgi:CheY-like chemotaxis protein